jgi:hypothetical protein
MHEWRDLNKVRHARFSCGRLAQPATYVFALTENVRASANLEAHWRQLNADC